MFKPAFFALVFSSAVCTVLPAANSSNTTASPNSGTVVAEVDGVKLTVGDFEKKNPSAFFHSRNVYYESQKKAVEQYIDEYLLERQARKEGVPVEKMLEKHLNAAIGPDPSEDAMRVYYEGVDTAEPFEAVRPQILASIKQRRLTKARAAYIQNLHNEAKVAIKLSPPRAMVNLKDTPLRGGSADAPIVLVEYADYECPYCQQIQPSIARLESEYKGKLTFGYKDVPLPNHASAQKASEAAHCAGNQGKYWEFHDRLFATKQLGVPQLKEHARALKLDTAAFDKCLDSGETAAAIRAQVTEASGFGMQGTPSFFINGRFFGNGSSYEELRKIIEEELAGQSQSVASVKQ